jgi:HSP20 family protein
MAIQVWRRPAREPGLWPDLDDFERAMSRIFANVYPTGTSYPPVNVWTGKDDVVLTAELPGAEPDDLDISVEGNMLTLRCTQKERERKKGEMYHRHECRHGSFARSWQLPFEVEQDRINAKLENGVLKLTLPRSEASKPKKVEIQGTKQGGKRQ